MHSSTSSAPKVRPIRPADHRGRLGVGKQVFPRSSRAQTFSATRRRTRAASWRLHPQASFRRRHCVDDGFWGTPQNVEGDTLVIPVDSPATLEAFRRDFRLQRQTGQHGLLLFPGLIWETKARYRVQL